ncbi:MAG: hypothetical protein IPP97_00050 [Candidatus Obscuribacter sp.]|jgi:hypothetical protein|nr:hypothetical protein [Candidatus Obscuribacter sp.]MBP6349508.1 hypothetical protein [Candidatus Obscuribacter sp.]MBP6591974.1 hypothetical protein [Candidatus Obscuribacter sp.]MBP7578411.1 hypothetical protein [Candidatus Obscuribacter sp.]
MKKVILALVFFVVLSIGNVFAQGLAGDSSPVRLGFATEESQKADLEYEKRRNLKSIAVAIAGIVSLAGSVALVKRNGRRYIWKAVAISVAAPVLTHLAGVAIINHLN